MNKQYEYKYVSNRINPISEDLLNSELGALGWKMVGVYQTITESLCWAYPDVHEWHYWFIREVIGKGDEE